MIDDKHSIFIERFYKNKHLRWRMHDKALKQKFNYLFTIPNRIYKNSLCDNKITLKIEYSHNTEATSFIYVRRFIKKGKCYRRYYKNK